VERITITIEEELAQEIDKIVTVRGYQSRSEAVRDLVRAGMLQTKIDTGRSIDCVATLAYVYQHGTRELPKRLANAFQDQHDLAIATMRVALDHENSMEVSVLKGPTAEVERFAEQVIAERGVRHGRVIVIPAAIDSERHGHGHGKPHGHEHIHVR
jgi:CopG family transcriptional regulator, nickel-responsive regulator